MPHKPKYVRHKADIDEDESAKIGRQASIESFANEKILCGMLDVGVGSNVYAKGDVNVDMFREGTNRQIGDQKLGEKVDPHAIENFVIADACHLPFKDEAFEVVFSSHTIEHVKSPFLMYSELCRVAERKVIVRCPHRRGSGAKRPFHLSYLDEKWFKQACGKLGFRELTFIKSYEHFFDNRIRFLQRILKGTIFLRIFNKLQRMFLPLMPFELESWLIKDYKVGSYALRFYVVSDDLKLLKDYFLSSPYVHNIKVFDNTLTHCGLPFVMNSYVANFLENKLLDCWMIFCHQDFILKESLEDILANKNINAVYGVIGVRLGANAFGRIVQTDGSFNGNVISEPEPVQTVDEMCLIVHSSLFRKGLKFDEQFRFHFYGADLCLQAYVAGFDVYAIQVNCQHKSRTLTGDKFGKDYYDQLKLFASKWHKFLPIGTTTRVIEVKDAVL